MPILQDKRYVNPNPSPRHSKITGDFGEYLVLYWLSKYGFECVHVDHVGIDLIAKNPYTNEMLGISVKARSRRFGVEGSQLSISNDNFVKAEQACSIFNCVPYFAIVIDQGNTIHAFILSMKELLKIHPQGGAVSSWKMSSIYLNQYRNNPEIISFEFTHSTPRWFGPALPVPILDDPAE